MHGNIDQFKKFGLFKQGNHVCTAKNETLVKERVSECGLYTDWFVFMHFMQTRFKEEMWPSVTVHCNLQI